MDALKGIRGRGFLHEVQVYNSSFEWCACDDEHSKHVSMHSVAFRVRRMTSMVPNSPASFSVLHCWQVIIPAVSVRPSGPVLRMRRLGRLPVLLEASNNAILCCGLLRAQNIATVQDLGLRQDLKSQAVSTSENRASGPNTNYQGTMCTSVSSPIQY